MRFASYKIKKGESVFHGTASNTIFTSLKGPAWVAKARAVAEHFARIATERPRTRKAGNINRILEFKAIRPLKLILIRGNKDWYRLLEYIRVDTQYFTPYKAAENAYDVLGRDYDGWIIPTNYFDGDDLLLFEPDSALEFVGQTYIDS